MARSVPLTEARAFGVMEDIWGMLLGIVDKETADRFISCLYGHKPAFLALCAANQEISADVIANHTRRDIFTEFLPVVGSVLGFNSQLGDLALRIHSGWLDNEVVCDGNRANRFALRKLPHVVFRSSRPARLIHLARRVREERYFPNATVWDVLAVLRSCRQRLPRKCAVCVMRECSLFYPNYERYDKCAPPSYMMFFLDGVDLKIRNVSENDFVPDRTLFLGYVASTVDLLA